MGRLRHSAVKILILSEVNVHLDITKGFPCIRNENGFRMLAKSHSNHGKMPGHNFHPRRNAKTVQPSEVKYPSTHYMLNGWEEVKDDFDVALQIPEFERPDKQHVTRS